MKFEQTLGIRLPIIQAPMAGVQGSRLTAAVSNAGGLGSLPCAMLSPGQLQEELSSLSSLTSAPFNLNFFCHKTPERAPAVEQAWRSLLAPYFTLFGIDPETVEEGAQRRPFDHVTADIIESARPAVVSFHFGLPAPDLLARVKGWGSIVLSSATTLVEAQWLIANGADAVIAQGLEAGGHRGHFLSSALAGQRSTKNLVAEIVQATQAPVIAAGGIATPDEAAAMLALGASAVQLGTAYLLCPEANTSDLHRAAIRQYRPQDTALTNVYSGRPARGIITRLMRDLGPLRHDVPAFPLASAAVTALRKAAESQGDHNFSPLWCGEAAPQFDGVSAGEVTRSFARYLS